MTKEIKYDYEPELDIIYIYSEDIRNGIIGCLSIGDFNIDVGNNNKIVGIELEEASKILRLSPDILSSLDKFNLIIKKIGNKLLIGINVSKGTIISSTSITTNSNQIPLQAYN